ncbi:hypothetical protein ACJVDH_12245 [Pedobacter sp. AW1-32]|uniref:hypothetical protein n=1 Tax=Pedobacter sp. AW1-32 TaxID=3383026 RepID=UPI003FF07E2C
MKLLVIFLLACSIGAVNVQAQGYFMQDVSGKPIKTNTYENISGSPYLFENWIKGTVTTLSGKKYNISDLKMDLIANKLLFKDSVNEVLSFSENITSFALQPDESDSKTLIFKTGFSGSKGLRASDFVQVLTEGKTTLLKKTNKIVSESRAYNSSTVDKSITTSIVYYFVNEDKENILLVLNKKNFAQNFSSHQDKIEAFLKDNKVNLKDEDDLIKIVTYYNAL